MEFVLTKQRPLKKSRNVTTRKKSHAYNGCYIRRRRLHHNFQQTYKDQINVLLSVSNGSHVICFFYLSIYIYIYKKNPNKTSQE